MDIHNNNPSSTSKKDTTSRPLLSDTDTERILVTTGLIILFVSGIFVLGQPW